jgi:hypothetical protein
MNCSRLFGAFSCLVALSLLGACAPGVTMAPASFIPVHASAASEAKTPRLLEREVVFQLPTGYVRALPAKSRWGLVGSLPQGDVLKPVDSVFSVEGRHVHEAWIVVRQNVLQGFYLPAEESYSPLRSPLPSLPFKEN